MTQVDLGLTSVRSLVLMTLIKNLGRHNQLPATLNPYQVKHTQHLVL
jgi:hypothetical protein